MTRKQPPARVVSPGAVLLLALALAATGCGNGGRPSRGPIVLIVIDTLRADHVSCYGYDRPTSPASCTLARDGVTFERAYTPRTATTPAVASILTGLYPHRHGVEHLYQVLPDLADTLPERLRGHGLRTGGFVSSFVMVDDFSGFAQGFEIYDDAVNREEPFRENFERSADETVDHALAWLAEAGPNSFLLVHLIEPHGPYTPPAGLGERFARPQEGPEVLKVPRYQRIPGLRFVSEYVARYDAEIASADQQVERLLQGLRELGWYDAATVVLTADHGESFGEEDRWFEHGLSVNDAEARVPLMIKFNDAGYAPEAGSRVARPVSLVDLHATLLAAAGVSPGDGPGASRDLRTALESGAATSPALTLLPGRRGLTFAAHGGDCSARWFVPRGSNLPATGTEPARQWRSVAREISPIDTPEPTLECREVLTDEIGRLVADLLTYRRDFPVTARRDVFEPGFRSRFVEQRGDPVVPLPQEDLEKLRSLGYVN